MEKHPVVVIGAGPSGLTAAYELVAGGIHPIVLEQADKVGGLARTEEHKGYRFDIGGHRFFTKVDMIQRLWEQMLGSDFKKVIRLSRILYDGQFFDYPLHLFDAMSKLGIWESVRIVASYIRSQLCPYPKEDTFEQWVSNKFGRYLFRAFFQA